LRVYGCWHSKIRPAGFGFGLVSVTPCNICSKHSIPLVFAMIGPIMHELARWRTMQPLVQGVRPTRGARRYNRAASGRICIAKCFGSIPRPIHDPTCWFPTTGGNEETLTARERANRLRGIWASARLFPVS